MIPRTCPHNNSVRPARPSAERRLSRRARPLRARDGPVPPLQRRSAGRRARPRWPTALASRWRTVLKATSPSRLRSPGVPGRARWQLGGGPIAARARAGACRRGRPPYQRTLADACRAILEDVAIDHPRDAAGAAGRPQIDFFTGDARMLRDRIARALAAMENGMPGYHASSACTPSGWRRRATTPAEEAGRARRRDRAARRLGAARRRPCHGDAGPARRRHRLDARRSRRLDEGSFCRPQLVASGAVPSRSRRDRRGAGAL